MGYPRTPLAKARATGRADHDAKRFRGRREPSSTPLGEPSTHLDDLERCVWHAFQSEIPWLTEADRSIVEAACSLRARLWQGATSVDVIGRLQSLLRAMGATPADRSRIVAPADDEADDPAAEFLQ